MTRAMIAVAKSQIGNIVDKLKLDPDEIARVAAGVLFNAGRKAGLDRRGLHALLDDAIDAGAVDDGRAANG